MSFRAIARRRVNQIELGERGELFGVGLAHVDREAARREPVDITFAERTKVARAVEDDHLVSIGLDVERRVQAEAREAEIGVRFRRRYVLEGEQVRRVADAARLARSRRAISSS